MTLPDRCGPSWENRHRTSPAAPRVVVPVMFTLRVRRQLKVLAAEALAVALLLPARLLVTTDAPLLRSATHETGIDYQVLR